jgi:molybdopterin/thiamine biosynthesis adenylyltransferase
VDSDTVELNNLNRQILHWTGDIGKNKTDSADAKLKKLNPEIKIETVRERIIPDNARALVDGCYLIVDAMDNLTSRYILNLTAIELGIPFIHGAVHGLEGRAMTILPGRTACLMCLYQGSAVSQKPPVVGATPGVIACIQVTEAIKYITGIGKLLTDRLLIYDGLNMHFSELKVSRHPGCQHCGSKKT